MSLRSFIEPHRVIIDPNTEHKASLFATRVIATVDYSDSNQRDRAKIQTDHKVSTIGEEAVRAVFLKFTSRVSGPDYQIYEGRNKSWNPDLVIDGIAAAVKCQTRSAGKKYGLSWTFQSSPTRTDPILRKPEAWVCFVELNDEKDRAAESVVFPPFQIRELEFREPRMRHLKGNKKVIYARGLTRMLETMKQKAIKQSEMKSQLPAQT